MNKYKNLTIVQNPLVLRDLSILREKSTGQYRFRHALSRISYSLAIEISRTFQISEEEIETPIERTKGFFLKQQIVLVPVLRSGLSMVNSFIEMIPDAKLGHIGLQRDEKTLEPVDYYYKTPKNLDISKVIILDPMLATGGSASAAVKFLQERGTIAPILACLIAAPEGVLKLESEHPDVKIYTASLDRCLNENGFIMPGLGDAGDRTFGTL